MRTRGVLEKLLFGSRKKGNIATFLLLCCAALIPVASGAAETGQKSELVLAYMTRNVPDVDPKDAAAAFGTYASELSAGLKLKVVAHVYDNVDSVIDDLQKGKVDLASLSPVDYLRIKNPVGLDPGVVSVRGGKKTVKYLILTHVNKGYGKVSDLRGKKISVLKDDDVGLLFLNATLLKQKLGEAKDFFGQIDEKSKASQIVLPVFFGQADACVINDVSFKTMVEMNPQLGKDLKTLTSSPDLLAGMGVFRKGMSVDLKEKIISVAKGLKTQPRGRQVLLLFKMEDLDSITESDLTTIKELVGEYDRMRPRKS
jgi:ABC-type phosphate/phosphonate transport system substrate-binding protein